MYPLGTILSIKYPLTVIMSTIIRNAPIAFTARFHEDTYENRVPLGPRLRTARSTRTPILEPLL